MSLRPRAEQKQQQQSAPVGRAMRTAVPSPYNDQHYLKNPELEDHDGAAWAPQPERVVYRSVKAAWVVTPSLGSTVPALCVFPRRASKKITFAPNVNLEFKACWTPVVARFAKIILTDVDIRGQVPQSYEPSHFVSTFKFKNGMGSTAVTLRTRISEDGSELLGYALYLPDTDYVLSFEDFTAPPSIRTPFDSSTAVLANKALTNYDPEDMTVVFSKLDESVHRELRVQRAQQSFKLFVNDLKQRSSITIDSINQIRRSVYQNFFQQAPWEPEFWIVDPERAPE